MLVNVPSGTPSATVCLPSQTGELLSWPELIDAITTTTIFANGPPAATVQAAPKPAPIPVAAIAGGAAGGVCLALAAVVVWVWWGKCIKRADAKKRKQALAALEVRENTRRNAAALTRTRSQYTPYFSLDRQPRTVTFVASNFTPTQSILKKSADPEKAAYTASGSPSTSNMAEEPPVFSRVPRPSPLSNGVDVPPPHRPTVLPQSPTQPVVYPRRANTLTRPVAPSPAARSHVHSTSHSSRGSGPRPPHHNPPPLAQQGSTASTGSAYSTQSGEERQIRVQPSLVMAALGHPDPRRSFAASYLSALRLSWSNSNEQSRLSQISAGSSISQSDDQPDIPIGYAA